MMASRYIDRKRYFLELVQTSREYYLDYLRKFKIIDGKCRVLEIGCGEGGNLLPFAESGCYVKGLDLSSSKIENAVMFFAEGGGKGEFFTENFLESESPKADQDKFDIIIVHDVIEHIEPEFKSEFISGIAKFMKPDGIVFMAFPPWHMPYGGHQQICRSRLSKLPFIHLLPSSVYGAWLKMLKEDKGQIEELQSIKRSGTTVELFEKLCDLSGFEIKDRKLWFINPHYKAKFNLSPAPLWKWLGNIPYLRNFFSTSAFYILSRK